MTQVTRENILEEYKKAVARKNELQNKSYKITASKPISCMGGMTVSHLGIDLIKGLYINIKEYFGDDDMNTILGIKTSKEDKFNGYTKEEWVSSLKARVAQIQDAEELVILEKQIAIYKKNLSADDKFKLDMEEAANAACE